MTKRMRILLGGILLTLMSVYFGVYVYSISLPKKGSYSGFEASWDGKGESRIDRVDPNGLAAGLLQAGDEMIAIDGVKIRDDPRLLIDSDPPPGTRFTLTIRREGALRDVSLLTVPHRTRERFDPLYYINLLFLLTAWGVFLLRPDDKHVWLLALMLATLTGLVGKDPANLPSWLGPVVGAAAVSGLLFFPVFVHFFLIFPDRSPLLRYFARLETLLYLPFLFVLLPVLGPSRSEIAEVKLWILQSDWFGRFISVAVFVAIAYLAVGLACLAINYRAASLANKRRLRVVMAGSAAGFLNLFLLTTGGSTGLGARAPLLWPWLNKALFITLPLVPLSFVYAIVRHKVIPVSLIIRRGVRYLLVSRGSILIEGIVVALAVTAVLTYIFSRFKPPGIVIGVVSAGVAIAAWKIEKHLHEKYLAPVIDRKFFRQSYDSHQIIADLADSLRSTTNLSQLTEQVATKIQSALQTESVAVLLRDEATGDYLGDSSCEYNAGNGKAILSEQRFRLPQYAGVVVQLNEKRQPIEVELNGSHSIEDEVLRRMKSAMLLPLAGKDGMPGIISLGARLGDLPYSREDKRLLMSVAGPTTFAIENARLVERMIEEARRREEIEAENEARAKELEEARQLQLSMLPKTVPQLPHLEIAAYMKTATEVGGDYYDFHLADDGALTIAVGDATGHGLKAGTVVTAMKSLFYSFADEPELLPVMNRSSRVLKRMNLRSLFMGLTVVKLNGRRLRISSAGMPPVLIYRAENRTVEEIMIKAMPLGSISSYTYREEQTAISPGDVLVLMSDGFPERFNPDGEMFDYPRAKQSLAEAAARTSSGIIEHFVEVGEKWAGGRPQDDDITFVVLKVK